MTSAVIAKNSIARTIYIGWITKVRRPNIIPSKMEIFALRLRLFSGTLKSSSLNPNASENIRFVPIITICHLHFSIKNANMDTYEKNALFIPIKEKSSGAI